MKRGIKKFSEAQIEYLVSLRRDLHLSYTLIGRMVGRDHTTILYHCRKAGIAMGHYFDVVRTTIRKDSKQKIENKFEELEDDELPKKVIEKKRFYKFIGQIKPREKSYKDYMVLSIMSQNLPDFEKERQVKEFIRRLNAVKSGRTNDFFMISDRY